MRRIRTIIGLLLILFSAAGLIFWEAKGREALLLDTVIVASETIPAGTVITRDLVSAAGVLEENKIKGCLDWDAMPGIIGQVALQDIVGNGQISKEYLAENDFYLGDNQSIFVICPEWIAMRSSAIRRGDWIDIYDGGDHNRIGTYRVAFVKDVNEIEVTDGEEKVGSNALDRVVSTAPISHLEIIADIKEYGKIVDAVRDDSQGLLLVQKQVKRK